MGCRSPNPPREFGPLILAFGAAEAIDVLLDDLVPSTGAPLPQLKQLVVGVLRMTASAILVAVPVFSVGAHPSVDRDPLLVKIAFDEHRVASGDPTPIIVVNASAALGDSSGLGRARAQRQRA